MSKRSIKPRQGRMHDEPDGGDAFVPDVARSHGRLIDDAAEAFAEEFIASVTSGEFVGEDARDEIADDEASGALFFDADDELEAPPRV